MKKADVIDLIEETLGDREQARMAVDSLLDGITQSLIKGETVSLRALGTFKRVQRQARRGINPRTGEKIQIKARKAVRFRSGTKLQKAVN